MNTPEGLKKIKSQTKQSMHQWPSTIHMLTQIQQNNLGKGCLLESRCASAHSQQQSTTMVVDPEFSDYPAKS